MIEVVFRQGADRVEQVDGQMTLLGRWGAYALQPVVERRTGRAVGSRLTTIIEQPGGWFDWKTRGVTHSGGNRLHTARTLSEAQTRIQTWAQRRFRYAEEVR